MPYPALNDPDRCFYSDKPIPNYVETLQWQRCPGCGRPIVAKPNGNLFPHVTDRKRARRRDAVQEGLIRYGLNRRDRW